jgi:branched-chain amino acid transport system permease protein
MRAVADNPDLARACGISAPRVLTVLWLIAGALSGLAGLLLGGKTIISPMMGWDMLLPAFAATILGTIGNPLGAVLGAVIIGVAQEVSSYWIGFTYKIGAGLGLMFLVLLVRPNGLFAARARVR